MTVKSRFVTSLPIRMAESTSPPKERTTRYGFRLSGIVSSSFSKSVTLLLFISPKKQIVDGAANTASDGDPNFDAARTGVQA